MSVLLPGLAVITLTASAVAGDGTCNLLPNGSFDDGLDGWTVTPLEQSSGDAAASAVVGMFDTGAALQVAATTGVEGNGGTARAELTLATTATVTGEMMRLRRNGGFEYVFQGTAGRSLVARIDVLGPQGQQASEVLVESDTRQGEECQPGIAILGTFFGDPVEIDLAAAGIADGDEVTVSVTVRVTASAAACQFSQTFATLVVDDFEFCTPDPADVNDDGVVDVLDLVAVITNWGTCPAPPETCAADVDGDGVVGVLDIVAVITEWG